MAKQNNENGRGRKFQTRQPGEKRSRKVEATGERKGSKDYKPRKESGTERPFSRSRFEPREGAPERRQSSGRPKRNFSSDSDSERGGFKREGGVRRSPSRPFSENKRTFRTDSRDSKRDFRDKSGDSRDKLRDFRDKPRDFRDKPRDSRDKPRDFRDKPRDFKDKPREFKDKPREFKDKPRDFRDKPREPRERREREEPRTRRTSSGDGGYVRKGENETSFGNYSGRRNESGDDRKTRKPYGKSEEKPDSPRGKRPAKTTRPTKYVKEDKFKKSTRLGADKNFKGSRKRLDETGRDLENANLLQGEEVRLNRYIANSGICSRREADSLIEQGLVTVNGKVVTELGSKVVPGDEVKVDGRRITPEKPVYIVLNKPKGYITSTSDPEGRATVLDLIDLPGKERIYPIGRLDRNTTGVLLLTNDGELAQKLMHPSFEIKKVYRVKLDKKPSKDHMLAWVNGINLEDGFMAFEQCGFVDKEEDDILGVEIHSGRNRIVRRMFEHFGYEVVALDRVLLGDFDHLKLGRGKWRFLNEKEIRYVERLKRKKPGKGLDVKGLD